MSKFTIALKEEISRLARKEVRKWVSPLVKKLSILRKTDVLQKRKIALLEKELIRAKSKFGPGIKTVSGEVLSKSRLSGKLIQKLRKKLKLSRTALANLLEVRSNSIYLWEKGKTSPRPDTRAKIISLRKLGRREIKKLLSAAK